MTHSPTDEGKVVGGEADRVGGAGVVQDGGDGEEALQVDVLVGVLPDDVGVGVNDAWQQTADGFIAT